MDDHRLREARHRRCDCRVGDGQLDAVAGRRGRLRRRRQRHDGRRGERALRPGRGRLRVARADRARRRLDRRRRWRRRGRTADDGAVDDVRVDVDRRARPRLLVAALVLMHALVIRPDAVAHVRIAEDALDAVPVGDPAGVGQPGADRRNVAHRRGRAAVDTRDVSLRAELGRPGGDERLHRRRARCVVDRVALHVEVDRAAGWKAEALGLRDRVIGRRTPLVGRGRCDRRELLQPALRDARGLQADVERQETPAGRECRGDPGC